MSIFAKRGFCLGGVHICGALLSYVCIAFDVCFFCYDLGAFGIEFVTFRASKMKFLLSSFCIGFLKVFAVVWGAISPPKWRPGVEAKRIISPKPPKMSPTWPS